MCLHFVLVLSRNISNIFILSNIFFSVYSNTFTCLRNHCQKFANSLCSFFTSFMTSDTFFFFYLLMFQIFAAIIKQPNEKQHKGEKSLFAIPGSLLRVNQCRNSSSQSHHTQVKEQRIKGTHATCFLPSQLLLLRNAIHNELSQLIIKTIPHRYVFKQPDLNSSRPLTNQVVQSCEKLIFNTKQHNLSLLNSTYKCILYVMTFHALSPKSYFKVKM